MSIAFDAATDGGDNGGVSTTSAFAHTSTGSNLIGFVGILGDVTAGGNNDILSVTWGGVACTLVLSIGNVSVSNTRYQYLYQIIGPNPGSQTILITAGSAHYIIAGAITYTGVLIDDSKTSQQSALSTSTTLTTSLTTTVSNDWVVLFEQGYDGGTAPGAGTGSTIRVYGVAFGNWGFFDSGLIASPSTPSMTTTRGVGSFIGITHILASFKPFIPGQGPIISGGAIIKGALIDGGRLIA